MSDMAKEARAAMKAKAKRLTTDPHQKVDSSTWTPPEPLDTTAKTGLRPISRRAFKSGGKVKGVAAKANMGQAPRSKSGNKPITADSMANKDMKSANEDRPGIKHVGGMKTGGRAKKDLGGPASGYAGTRQKEGEDYQSLDTALRDQQRQYRPGDNRGQGPTKNAGATMDYARSRGDKGDATEFLRGRKDGGRTKKMGGGGLNPRAMMAAKRGTPAGVNPAMARSPGRPDPRMMAAMKAQAAQAASASAEPTAAGGADMPPMKKGGRAKKYMGGPMMQPGGLMAPVAGALGGGSGAAPMPVAGGSGVLPDQDKNKLYGGNIGANPYKKGGKVHDDVAEDKALIKKMVKPSARTARKEGGGVFSGEGYPGKVPGATGGRTAHARGGKAGKGKTNINIIIGAGKPGMGGPDPMGGPTLPPPGMGGPPPGATPIPMPMPPGGAPAPAAAPMPMPYPVPMGGGGGGPLPRKAGGRTYRSYKDMDAGAGGGEGRLEKTEIAEHKRGERKAGGRTYRSYKDMDAGSGGGLGRLEKTEIQAHKG